MLSWQIASQAHQYPVIAFTGHLDSSTLALWHGAILALAALRLGPTFIDLTHLNVQRMCRGAVLTQLARYVVMPGRCYVWCGSQAAKKEQQEYSAMAAAFGVCWEFEDDLDAGIALHPQKRAV